MRATGIVSALVLLPGVVLGQGLFNVPLRICMGGRQTVDSYGRTWLGEGPGTGDPLNIRPNDAGGAETAENWSLAAFDAGNQDSMDNLGFDSTHPGDRYIFNTIRWDNGATPGQFLMEIPIAEGEYTVNMYFNEGCCTNRHFRIDLQGVTVDEDVSYLDYDPITPALGRMGRLTFEGIAVGPDNLLKVDLLPCLDPECPGGGDPNPILDALEVISGPNCDHLGLDFNCAFDIASVTATGTWVNIPGSDGYKVFRNGVPLMDLPAGSTTFTDSTLQGIAAATYVLQALDGAAVLSECRCQVSTFSCPSNLACTSDNVSQVVSLSWTTGNAVNITSFDVSRDGALLASLAPTETTFEDMPGKRSSLYTVTPVTDPPGQCAPLTCYGAIQSFSFDLPLRINMGGAETVDSHGDTWLADGPGPGDPQGIRPDDTAGANWIESWCLPEAQSLIDLGFDPTHPGDRYILGTIRWDVGPLLPGGDAIDFRIELQVPNASDYLVNLYFNECCCTNRHFRVEINGVLVNEDVSYEDYASPPALGKAGRLTFSGIAVTDGVLRIALLPCDPADCPLVGDNNAIVNAIEVLSNPCADPEFRGCPGNLSCSVSPLGGTVTGRWSAPICFATTGYEVRRNGVKIQDLPGSALSFTDALPARFGYYEVQPLVPAGIDPCPSMTCTVINSSAPFETPLRLNMGGNTLTDSRGQLWLGDGTGAGDLLSIRPDDLGGNITVQNWCVARLLAEADSLQSLGYDPSNPNDMAIFNTIRYDDGVHPSEYRLELPLDNGTYTCNFYFTECCCTFRHFTLEIQGIVVLEDTHAGVYSAVPRLGRTGRLTFDGVEVGDGFLRIAFLPCPVCGGTDPNAIVDAIEILPGEPPVPTCPRDLTCALDVGLVQVTGSWTGPEALTVDSYDIYRDGAKILSVPGSATSFTDTAPPCQGVLIYEVQPISAAPGFLCPGMRMRCTVVQPGCPFSTPLRLNMGGSDVLDSHGDLWLGDGPGPGDPFEIRPDDLGGNVWQEFWAQAFGPLQPDSLTKLGFDAGHPGDQYLFGTIRWDNGGDAVNFLMDIPVEDGTYTVNMYFVEGCCTGRHFKIEIEGLLVDDDVSYLDYDPVPALGKVGKLSYEVDVSDGVLSIGLLPCPECPRQVGEGVDNNAIISALEILGGTVVPPGPRFVRGDANGDGRVNITDPIFSLAFSFTGGPSPPCLDAADVNDDDKINITDPIVNLNWLFQGGPGPRAPAPATGSYSPADCGLDPTTVEDPLTCLSFTPCP